MLPTEEEWDRYHNVHDLVAFHRRLKKSGGYAIPLWHGERELLEHLGYKVEPTRQIQIFLNL